MIVDLLDNAIRLDQSKSKLKPYQISQIYHLGFAKSPEDNSYRLSSGTCDSVLPRVLAYFDKEGISYTLTPSCQQYLTRLSQAIADFEEIRLWGREYKEGRIDRASFNEFASSVDSIIIRELRDHQLRAAYHLYLVGNGANFSVPGSGKTAVVLSVYEKLRLEDRVNLLYVVGPSACFAPWKTEFELTLGRKPDARVLSGGDQTLRKSEYFSTASRSAELYLTTYQTLLNDQEEVRTFLSQQGIKAFLVVDEAHYIKQIGGNWADAVLGISEWASYRCVLTGTPLPRSYSDVFNLFDFLWPRNSPIDSDTKTGITLYEQANDAASAKQALERTIGPFFYRVRKADLGLIPPVFHSPFILPMNPYERMIYDAIETRIRGYAKEDYLRNIDLVENLRRGRITRLRQCVSDVSLLSSGIKGYKEDIIGDDSNLAGIILRYRSLEVPAKLEALTAFIGKLQERKEKVVIWSHFIGTLNLIAICLARAGYYCKLIYGATPTEQTKLDEEETRESIRREFVDPNSGLDILIANPAACGESISLHKTCFHAVYYDLSYNCAQYLQSLDRIHRVGGSEVNQANYYFLQYESTIDQDIRANLDKKTQRMYDVIEEEYSIHSLDMFEEDDELGAYERLFGE